MTKTSATREIFDTFAAATSATIKRTQNRWSLVEEKLLDDLSNVSDIKTYIVDYVKSGKTDFNECIKSYVKPAVNVVVPTPAQTANAEDLLAAFLTASAKTFAETKSEEIEKKVVENATVMLEKYIEAKYGILPHKVEVNINDERITTIDGVVHEAFDEVLSSVISNEPVFLVGPAGSGKNYLCEQVAKALGLDFYFSNALTQEYYLTGFTDANGHYQPSQFYEAFKNGGLFMLDELDASIPDVLIKLNAALANHYFDFPAPIGRVAAHPNFRVMAAGNTYGLGADFEYVGRNQLDASSLDRFMQIEVNYDEKIELDQARGDNALVEFAHEIRRICKEKGILFIFSYRSINRIAKLKSTISTIASMSLPKLLKSALFKGLGKDDMRTLVNNLMISNEYTDAMKELVTNS